MTTFTRLVTCVCVLLAVAPRTAAGAVPSKPSLVRLFVTGQDAIRLEVSRGIDGAAVKTFNYTWHELGHTQNSPAVTWISNAGVTCNSDHFNSFFTCANALDISSTDTWRNRPNDGAHNYITFDFKRPVSLSKFRWSASCHNFGKLSAIRTFQIETLDDDREDASWERVRGVEVPQDGLENCEKNVVRFDSRVARFWKLKVYNSFQSVGIVTVKTIEFFGKEDVEVHRGSVVPSPGGTTSMATIATSNARELPHQISVKACNEHGCGSAYIASTGIPTAPTDIVLKSRLRMPDYKTDIYNDHVKFDSFVNTTSWKYRGKYHDVEPDYQPARRTLAFGWGSLAAESVHYRDTCVRDFVYLYKSGSYGYKDLGEAHFNEAIAKQNGGIGAILRRECRLCPGKYKTLYYKRIAAIGNQFSVYKTVIKNWAQTPGNNVINVHFEAYTQFVDAKNGANKLANIESEAFEVQNTLDVAWSLYDQSLKLKPYVYFGENFETQHACRELHGPFDASTTGAKLHLPLTSSSTTRDIRLKMRLWAVGLVHRMDTTVKNALEERREYSSADMADIVFSGFGWACSSLFQASCLGFKPKAGDDNPYVILDLGSVDMLVGFLVGGHKSDSSEYTKSVLVETSNDKLAWTTTNDGDPLGTNLDGTLETRDIRLPSVPIECRYIRVTLKSKFNSHCLRIEPLVLSNPKYYWRQQPTTPENRRIYSSTWNNALPGQIYVASMLNSATAWVAKYNNQNQWIKINLGKIRKVTGLRVGGRADCCHNQVVTSIKVNHGNDGQNWHSVDGGKEFMTNVKPVVGPTKLARYVKVKSGGAYLQISQLAVYASDNPTVNVALKKPTTSSGYGWGGKPEYAVDGDLRPQRHAEGEYHSNSEAGSWWQVDLQKGYKVSKVVYYNRKDCCSSRSSGMVFELLDAEKKLLYTSPGFQGSTLIQTFQSIQLGGGNTELQPGEENIYFGTGPISAQWLQVIPTAWNSHISMTVDVLVDREGYNANEVYVMENPETVRTYSSSWDHASPGNMYATSSIHALYGWRVHQNLQNTLNSWLKIDTGRKRAIIGLIVGSRADDPSWHVKTLHVEVSDDDATWSPAVHLGDPISTNSGNNRLLQKIFFPDGAVMGRFVKIVPQSWNNGIGLRVDVIGKHADASKHRNVRVSLNDKVIFNEDRPSVSCVPSSQPGGKADTFILNVHENNRKYSSVHNNDATGTGHAQSRLGSKLAWSAKLSDDTNPWAQLDLGTIHLLHGIVVQGPNALGNYGNQIVKNVKVETSLDGITWTNVGVFDTNLVENSNAWSHIYFPNPIHGKFVKIHPLSWNSWASLRAGIIASFSQKEFLDSFAWQSYGKPIYNPWRYKQSASGFSDAICYHDIDEVVRLDQNYADLFVQGHLHYRATNALEFSNTPNVLQAREGDHGWWGFSDVALQSIDSAVMEPASHHILDQKSNMKTVENITHYRVKQMQQLAFKATTSAGTFVGNTRCPARYEISFQLNIEVLSDESEFNNLFFISGRESGSWQISKCDVAALPFAALFIKSNDGTLHLWNDHSCNSASSVKSLKGYSGETITIKVTVDKGKRTLKVNDEIWIEEMLDGAIQPQANCKLWVASKQYHPVGGKITQFSLHGLLPSASRDTSYAPNALSSHDGFSDSKNAISLSSINLPPNYKISFHFTLNNMPMSPLRMFCVSEDVCLSVLPSRLLQVKARGNTFHSATGVAVSRRHHIIMQVTGTMLLLILNGEDFIQAGVAQDSSTLLNQAVVLGSNNQIGGAKMEKFKIEGLSNEYLFDEVVVTFPVTDLVVRSRARQEGLYKITNYFAACNNLGCSGWAPAPTLLPPTPEKVSITATSDTTLQIRAFGNTLEGSVYNIQPPSDCAEIMQSTEIEEGYYYIKPKQFDSKVLAFCDQAGRTHIACDQLEESGGVCIQSSNAKDENTCKEFGMDIVVPRSKIHLNTMLAHYGFVKHKYYFEAVPGIYSDFPGQSIPPGATMTSGSITGYHAIDYNEWWLRDTAYAEPDGDYKKQCWLGIQTKETLLSFNYDFDDADQHGWTCGGSPSACGSFGYICGGYNKRGSNEDIKKTFTVVPGIYKISADVFAIDSWDPPEKLEIYVNNDLQWAWQLPAFGGDTQECGGSWTDKYVGKATFEVAVASSEMEIKFTSTINQGSADESLAIDNLRVQQLSVFPVGGADRNLSSSFNFDDDHCYATERYICSPNKINVGARSTTAILGMALADNDALVTVKNAKLRSYEVALSQCNEFGCSPPRIARTSVPSMPSFFALTQSSSLFFANISWAEADENGSPVIGYKVIVSSYDADGNLVSVSSYPNMTGSTRNDVLRISPIAGLGTSAATQIQVYLCNGIGCSAKFSYGWNIGVEAQSTLSHMLLNPRTAEIAFKLSSVVEDGKGAPTKTIVTWQILTNISASVDDALAPSVPETGQVAYPFASERNVSLTLSFAGALVYQIKVRHCVTVGSAELCSSDINVGESLVESSPLVPNHNGRPVKTRTSSKGGSIQLVFNQTGFWGYNSNLGKRRKTLIRIYEDGKLIAPASAHIFHVAPSVHTGVETIGVVRGLKASKSYTFQIAAKNGDHVSAWTAISFPGISPGMSPPDPPLVSISDEVNDIRSTYVFLTVKPTFLNGAEATNVSIYTYPLEKCGVDSANWNTQLDNITVSLGNVNSYELEAVNYYAHEDRKVFRINFEGLQNGGKYLFRATVYNAMGSSEMSPCCTDDDIVTTKVEPKIVYIAMTGGGSRRRLIQHNHTAENGDVINANGLASRAIQMSPFENTIFTMQTGYYHDYELTFPRKHMALISQVGVTRDDVTFNCGGHRCFDFSSGYVPGEIKGITFTNSSAPSGGNGGIMFLGPFAIFSSPLKITNCAFLGGSAKRGGAIFIFRPGVHIFFDDILFRDNVATDGGGAICFNSVKANLTNIHFSKNAAQYGGALAVSSTMEASVVHLANFTSIKDQASSDGGAFYFESSKVSMINGSGVNHVAKGSGSYMYAKTSSIEIDRAHVMGSVAAEDGTVGCYGTQFGASNVVMKNNVARDGGCIFGVLCAAYIQNCDFVENIASRHGGAVALTLQSEMTADNSTFSRNNAAKNKGDGGALYYHHAKYSFVRNSNFVQNLAGRGGAVRIVNSPFESSGNQFSKNQASAGGGGGNFMDSSRDSPGY